MVLPDRKRELSNSGNHNFLAMSLRVACFVCFIVVVGLLWPGLTSATKADVVPFNGSEVAPNIAIIEVTETGVFVDLEIFVEDIPVFIDIIPTHWFSEQQELEVPESERLARFGRDVLSVSTPDGQVLPVQVKTVEPRMRVDRASPLAGQTDPLTGRVVPSPPQDPRVVFARLFYPFDGLRPKSLTFKPPAKDGAATAAIGMQVSDRNVPVTEFRYLSAAATLVLDWNDPWHSHFTATSLNRSAQDGTRTFLYVEPREVRQEVLIRLRELAPYIDFDFETGAQLSEQSQAGIINAATDFFFQNTSLEMDAAKVSASSGRASMLVLNAQGFRVIENEEPVDANAAFVGVILSYPIVELPEKIDVDWSLFDSVITQVPVVMTDAAGPFFGGVTPDSPSYTWVNHLLTYENPRIEVIVVPPIMSKTMVWALFAVGVVFFVFGRTAAARKNVPWIRRVSFATAGVAVAAAVAAWSGALDRALIEQPDIPEAESLVSQMVKNLNVTVLEISETARSDVLSDITTEQSHQAISAELERGLAIRVPGGSLARATAVTDLTVEEVLPLQDGSGFRVLVNWTTIARASHWGHDHNRAVRYRVLAELVPLSGTWRLDGLTVLEARTPNA